MKSEKKIMNLLLDREIIKQFKSKAVLEGSSYSAFGEKMIKEYLGIAKK